MDNLEEWRIQFINGKKNKYSPCPTTYYFAWTFCVIFCLLNFSYPLSCVAGGLSNNNRWRLSTTSRLSNSAHALLVQESVSISSPLTYSRINPAEVKSRLSISLNPSFNVRNKIPGGIFCSLIPGEHICDNKLWLFIETSHRVHLSISSFAFALGLSEYPSTNFAVFFY